MSCILDEFECNDESMLNNEINYSSSAPVSFNAMREQTMIQEPEVDNVSDIELFAYHNNGYASFLWLFSSM